MFSLYLLQNKIHRLKNVAEKKNKKLQMMFYKSHYLTLTMILMISLALANAPSERSPEEYELYKERMKIELKRLTGEDGEVEEFTVKDYARGLILNWVEKEIRKLDVLLMPYYYRVAENMIPGPHMHLRDIYCTKLKSNISIQELTQITEPILYLDPECFEALAEFGDDKAKALFYARTKIKLETIDVEKKKHIEPYLKNIADNITFKIEVEDPDTFCKYHSKYSKRTSRRNNDAIEKQMKYHMIKNEPEQEYLNQKKVPVYEYNDIDDRSMIYEMGSSATYDTYYGET